MRLSSVIGVAALTPALLSGLLGALAARPHAAAEYLFEAGRVVELLDAGCELADVRSFMVSASEELDSSIGLPTIVRAASAVWEFHRTEEES